MPRSNCSTTSRAVGAFRASREKLKADQASLQASHEDLLAELEQRNEWADGLDAELKKSREIVAQLQAEIEVTHTGYKARPRQVEAELGSHSYRV